MELATGHAPYANFSLTNIIIMTMHSPVPELERTFSDVCLLFHIVVVSMLHFPLLYPCSQGCLSTIVSQRPAPPLLSGAFSPTLVPKFLPLFPSPFIHPCLQAPFFIFVPKPAPNLLKPKDPAPLIPSHANVWEGAPPSFTHPLPQLSPSPISSPTNKIVCRLAADFVCK